MSERYLLALLATTLLLLQGCAGLYFKDAGKPPAPTSYALSEYPAREYWAGIVFNGAKVGFSHFKLTPSDAQKDSFIIKSQAYLRFRFLTYDKEIILKSEDHVAGDLTLKRFYHEYTLDNSHLEIRGRVRHSDLEITTRNPRQEVTQSFPLQEKIYPASVINIFPLVQGLEIGKKFHYLVFDGQTQSVDRVDQEVVAYEESELFSGRAFKIKTRLHGQSVTSWIDISGRPQLELSHGGIIISVLENEKSAMKYLAQAALNKDETLLGFCLIKTEQPLAEPERVKHLELYISGVGNMLFLPADDRQACEPFGKGVVCRVHADWQYVPEQQIEPVIQVPLNRYLESSFIIPSDHPSIQQQANRIINEGGRSADPILLLVEWIKNSIRQEAVDVFSALDVLEYGKAECQGHSYLYAAFARALKIPTRIVNGIVYSAEHQGFLYHTWAESYHRNRWVAVDPTFYQVPADATHVKFVEGERISDLLSLVEVIGRIRILIRSVEYSAQPPSSKNFNLLRPTANDDWGLTEPQLSSINTLSENTAFQTGKDFRPAQKLCRTAGSSSILTRYMRCTDE